MMLCKGRNMRIGLFLAVLAAFIFSGAVMPVTSIAQEEKKLTAKEAKDMINNSTWKIELKEMSTGKNREEISDTLKFTDNRIVSDKMESEGFSPTNFTVRIKGEDRVIWETMQTSEKKGIAFWRGELREGQPMRGVLSWHIKENKVVDYSFSSDGSKKWGPDGIIEEKAPEPVVEEVVIEETAVLEVPGDEAVSDQAVQTDEIVEVVEEVVEVVAEEPEEKSKKRSKRSLRKK